MDQFISFLTSEAAGGIGLILLFVGGGIAALGNYLREEDYVPLVYLPVFAIAVIVLVLAVLFVGGWMYEQVF